MNIASFIFCVFEFILAVVSITLAIFIWKCRDYKHYKLLKRIKKASNLKNRELIEIISNIVENSDPGSESFFSDIKACAATIISIEPNFNGIKIVDTNSSEVENERLNQLYLSGKIDKAEFVFHLINAFININKKDK